MKGKSVAFQIIATLVLVISAYMSNFNPSVQQWLGAVVFGGTLLLQSPIMSTGSWPSGWSWVIWASNIGGIAIQLGGYFSENNLIPADIINGALIAVNLFLATWVKDYGTGSSVK